jgi:hypothetical protein
MSATALPIEAGTRALKGPVPADFEAFYRQHLRFRTGDRVSSAALRCRYLAWAEASGAPEMSFTMIRRAMENIGHKHRASNGIYYADAAFAEAAGGEPDNFPAPPLIAPDEAALLLNKVDHVTDELSAVRARLAQLADRRTGSHG